MITEKMELSQGSGVHIHTPLSPSNPCIDRTGVELGSLNQQARTSTTNIRQVWTVPVCLGILVITAYWPIWGQLAQTWMKNPQYSHGFLVLPFALYLLWHRREYLTMGFFQPTLWAIPILILAAGMRLAGARYYIGTLEQYSIFPAIAGLMLAFIGWSGLRWGWPSIAFLFFMIPLHGRIAGLLTEPLQRIATQASTFLLQTVGIPAVASGNVIHLTDVDVGVVEACNGLRMMTSFFALSVAISILVNRPLWQKALIAASAIPIAIGCNILRIAVTGIFHETVGHEIADRIFHDLAGWLMMPAALIVLWVGLRVLDRVFIPLPSFEKVGSKAIHREVEASATTTLPNRHITTPPLALQVNGK
jgi:exosortase